jgi:dethiobiotin synthetase
VSGRGVFVTGTDTGVGKTVVACALIRGLRSLGLQVAAMKPVASGSERTSRGLRNADALALVASTGLALPYSEVNPYCFEPPISPHIAAKESGIRIDISTIKQVYEGMSGRHDWVVIEGAGGWFAPIGERRNMADLAWALAVPAVLVVGLKLGCLNHAKLTHAGIEARGVSFAGWVASAVDPAFERAEENLASLARLLGSPPLAVVPHATESTGPLTLTQAALRLTQSTPQAPDAP